VAEAEEMQEEAEEMRDRNITNEPRRAPQYLDHDALSTETNSAYEYNTH